VTFSRKHALFAAVVAALSCGTAYLHADDAEDELKSAIVLSFLRYSTWKSPLPAGGPLTVGVLGRTSMRQTLQRHLEGKSVDNRTIHVVEVKSAGDPCHCQAIYIATDRGAEVKQALQSARATHALSIGENARFLELGGSVNLLVLDGHMSFEVSLEALEEGGVDISSRLLRLGQVRKRRPA
jgi:YfiR/HmsC-like